MMLRALFTAAILIWQWPGHVLAQHTEMTTSEDMKIIRLGEYEVPVVAGGLYDRYRSKPPLSIIAEESPETDLSWFETLEKTQVDMGFPSWSPNFYYENSRISMVYTAELERLRKLMPEAVRDIVQPLQVWPGRGLVVLTAYAYHYCDNDQYNELALSIVIQPPGKSNLGPLSLASQAWQNDYWGYVLKLPVNTELARVRGVAGYALPKWLTRIDYRESQNEVIVEMFDAETGNRDLLIQAKKLDELSNTTQFVKNSFVNTDARGQLTSGYAVSRQLSHGSSSRADDVSLSLGDGSLATFIKSLGLGKLLKYEYVPRFQSALYAPEPLANTDTRASL